MVRGPRRCDSGTGLRLICAVRLYSPRVYAGHVHEETKDEATGKMIPGKNVIDGDYASHGIYFVVRQCARQSPFLQLGSLGLTNRLSWVCPAALLAPADVCVSLGGSMEQLNGRAMDAV